MPVAGFSIAAESTGAASDVTETTKPYTDDAFKWLSFAMQISELFESCKIGAAQSQFPIKCAILKLRFAQIKCGTAGDQCLTRTHFAGTVEKRSD